MEKILQCKLTSKQNSIAYKIFSQLNDIDSYIHNLSSHTNIPFYVKFILILGLNFCVTQNPTEKNFNASFEESIRRLSWNIYFQILGDQKALSPYERFIFQCKKRSFKTKVQCPLTSEIFNPNMSSILFQQIRRHTRSEEFPPKQLLTSCSNFLKNNNLLVKNADKNAGICIISKDLYNDEVYRQLSDLTTYRPSCRTEYELAMCEIIDKCKYMKLDLGNGIKMHNLLIQYPKPASFYLLPKVHKVFHIFPPGRPISSTCNSINRNVSAYVDFTLKPIMCNIPGILLDTTHFLHVLDSIQLEPNKTYALITYDIDSMYTNLNVNRCKQFCMLEFMKYKALHKLPIDLSERDMRTLLNISLDYNYLEYENAYFVQHKGIQMGNCASVSIANITAYHELKDLFINNPEIMENLRFVDDGFMIVETTNIENLDTWTTDIFKHEYLSFTVQHSFTEINFLDVTVKLVGNTIQTSLYKKPMNKCMYLSYFSNHPKHLLRSLPYSQGIRIKRICSDINECKLEIDKMVYNFSKRGYPHEVLQECIEKLNTVQRYDLLKPKSKYLIQNLTIFHPEILHKYEMNEYVENMQIHTNDKQDFYVVVPYYSNVFKLKKVILDFLNGEILQCNDQTIRDIFQQMNIHIVYSVTNKLEVKLKK